MGFFNIVIIVYNIVSQQIFVKGCVVKSCLINIDLLILFWIPILLPFPFWIFDGLFKHFQHTSVARSEAIQDFLNGYLKKSDKNDSDKPKKKIYKYIL